MLHRIIDSPVGELTLVGEGGALSGLYFAEHIAPARRRFVRTARPIGIPTMLPINWPSTSPVNGSPSTSPCSRLETPSSRRSGRS